MSYNRLCVHGRCDPCEECIAEARKIDMAIARSLEGKLCEGCPPADFPNAPTRCLPCPRRHDMMQDLLTMVENDCEDQGFALLSDGCRSCQYWEPEKSVPTRPQLVKVERHGGVWWCCPRCHASYGAVIG